MLIIEDDGRTGYAYLRDGHSITSDVWLYNHEGIEEPSWDDGTDLPFPNKPSFMRFESLVLGPDSLIRADWDEEGVDVYVDDVLTARLARGACPGWSRLAATDGPLARVLTATGETTPPPQ